MIRKTVTYNVIEKEDLERIVSKILGKDIKVSMMDVELTDWVPSNYAEDNILEKACGITFNVFVDGEQVDPINDDYLSLPDINQAILHEKYIFDFDVKQFKSYKRMMENLEGITDEELEELIKNDLI